MKVKLLVSGLPNTGKSTLLKSLDPKNTLVISRDGKRFPFSIPHKSIEDFIDADDLITQIEGAVATYVEKYDAVPETVVIDSISKILLDIEARILKKVKSFPYGVINTEISKLMDFLEGTIAANCHLIMVSHAILNTETDSFELVNAGGSWGKKGGAISEVDNAIFIEIKGKKRIIHHRSPKLAARTTLDDLPESQDIEDYNLQEHMDLLISRLTEVDEFAL